MFHIPAHPRHIPGLHVTSLHVPALVAMAMLLNGCSAFDRLININLKGPYFLTQLVARRMIDLKSQISNSKSRISNPKIVNITSVSAYTASTNRGGARAQG